MNYEDNPDNHKVLSRDECPHCGSSQGYLLYADGHRTCYSCRKTTWGHGKDPNSYEYYLLHERNNSVMSLAEVALPNINTVNFNTVKVTTSGFVSEIKDRKISKKTCELFGVRIAQDEEGTTIKHIYPYYDKNNTHIANKIRNVATKEFIAEPLGALGRAGLFGENLFKNSPSKKYITICEGEMDALSVSEIFDNKWPVVSIKDGAAGAVRSCKNSYDFLNSFENIIICFDNDEPGKKASKNVAEIFEPNKCRIVSLDLKDANDYLKAGKREEFVKLWWAAKVYTPAGIVNLADYGDKLYEESQQQTCLYPFSGLNEKLYGIRTGELVTLTAGTGTGKSSVVRELMHHVLRNTQENIGVISLEENVRTTIFHLMSVEANARLYIREIREDFPKEDLRKWQQSTVGTGRFFAFDHFGSLGTEEILARVRYMVKALDCRWVFLDHLSILVSGLDGMDERRNIDVLMTKLRSLVEETNCALILVSHLRRTSSDSGHEEGKEVSLAHLRGSQSIAQLSDAVIALERNQQSDDQNVANTTTIRVLKNRYSGDTGISCHLFFNHTTGRLHEVENLGDDLNGNNNLTASEG